MMQGKSSLNADAAPYVPISKNSDAAPYVHISQNSDGDNKAAKKVIGVTGKLEDLGEAVGCQLPDDVFVDQSAVEMDISDASSSDRSPIKDAAANQSMMDDRQMTVEFLMSGFSGYSENSVSELLDFCNGDVVAVMDMLEQFECEHAESAGTLAMQHGAGPASQNSESSRSGS